MHLVDDSDRFGSCTCRMLTQLLSVARSGALALMIWCGRCGWRVYTSYTLSIGRLLFQYIHSLLHSSRHLMIFTPHHRSFRLL